MEVYFNDGNTKTKNNLVQVMTIYLIKDNYLQWSVVIAMGIIGRRRFTNIARQKLPPMESDPSWETWSLENIR